MFIHNIERKHRGLDLIEFTDRYGERCSLQKSSLATEEAIWFGIDDAKPQIMSNLVRAKGKGWEPVKFPEGTSFTTRMHLTKDQVKELLPYLQKFADTGEIV